MRKQKRQRPNTSIQRKDRKYGARNGKKYTQIRKSKVLENFKINLVVKGVNRSQKASCRELKHKQAYKNIKLTTKMKLSPEEKKKTPQITLNFTKIKRVKAEAGKYISNPLASRNNSFVGKEESNLKTMRPHMRKDENDSNIRKSYNGNSSMLDIHKRTYIGNYNLKPVPLNRLETKLSSLHISDVINCKPKERRALFKKCMHSLNPARHKSPKMGRHHSRHNAENSKSMDNRREITTIKEKLEEPKNFDSPEIFTNETITQRSGLKSRY
ncbi:unnamed protein product [Moneuplotes crassus]|uniref:Uncharacterized protein n=1 Tax=Euplotes crassus TaxID=5936 RepID=A0AAD1UQ03_EUPCR|nr:unnamed protein product [Moneuplotes crassus]